MSCQSRDLCGRWLRAGDPVPNPGALVPQRRYIAQASAPQTAWEGEKMRVRGLGWSPAGMPTAAVAEEILLPGPGQIKALISCGANPAASWPDQNKTLEALRSLDLLVQVDAWMSEAAREADYVIASKTPLEIASSSLVQEIMSMQGTNYGPSHAYAQYAEPVVEPPEGYDVIEDWTLSTKSRAGWASSLARSRLALALALALTTRDQRAHREVVASAIRAS
jgi:anaerobic selenocysteine-containing dehydrogenase